MRTGQESRESSRHVAAGLLLTGLAAVVLMLASFDVRAAADRVSASQFQHTVWTVRDGAPADVWAITQTDDGWLWFGGTEGLSRFDGVRFQKMDLAPEGGLSTAVTALYALRSGGLLVGHLSGGVSVLRGREVKQFDTPETRRSGSVIDFVESRSGAIWVSAVNGLLRFDGRTWQVIGADWDLPPGRTGAPFVDADDTLWVSTGREIFSLRSGSRRFVPSGTRVDRAVEFIQTPDGRVWYSDSDGTRLLPAQTARTAPPGPLRKSFTALFDREGNYWSHWAQDGMAVPEPAVQDIREVAAGLKTLFQDREGNVWVTEDRPLIHRLRRPRIVQAVSPPPTFSIGLWPWSNIAIDPLDRVWLAMLGGGNISSPDDGMRRFTSELQRVQQNELSSTTAIDRDRSGAIWVGGRQGLWTLRKERFERAVELPEGAQDAYVTGLTAECAGGLWVSVRGVGLLRHDGVGWHSDNGGVANLPRVPPAVQTCDAAGRLWLGYLDGTVASVEHDRAVVFAGAAAPQVGLVSALGGGRHTMVGGERGLALFRDGRFLRLEAGIAALEGATGIVEAADGDVWLNGARGAVRIPSRELDKPSDGDRLDVRIELFDESDGYPLPANNLAGPHTTMAVGRDGRIWLVAMGGLATIDPAHTEAGAVADVAVPPVVIESIDAGRRISDPAKGMALAERTRSVTIDYTALDYSHPDRLQFRYRLDGVDDGWVNAATRRQASYSNLGPGSYRFVVNVADANGRWTDSTASLDFVIPPTFVQSRFFLALCLLTVVVLLTLAYRVNIRRVEARQRRLLEERVGERERIARELHDTLLQGTQALIFNLHVAVKAIPQGDATRSRLAEALSHAENAMSEGRDRIQSLRGGPDTQDELEQLLAREGAEFAAQREVTFEIVVEGRERPVRPEIVGLTYRVAREAMLNAFRHAEARSIEIQIGYLVEALHLRVVDDGVGIADHAAEHGAHTGHWGLTGMHERAEGVGATLSIWSRPRGGTEIELVIPAAIAYLTTTRQRGWFHLGRLLERVAGR